MLAKFIEAIASAVLSARRTIRSDYIHDNPLRHGLCENPQDWPYSSIHRFIAQGIYPSDWGTDGRKEKPQGY